MKISFADLWRFNGTADRGAYALTGFVGFALLHNLNRLLATLVFHLRWDLFNYWVPLRDLVWFTTMSANDALFLATMVALALPFMWVGIAMTMKRLRSANLPLRLLILFFVPFLNLLFFLALCLFPERSSLPGELAEKPAGTRLARLLPESKVWQQVVAFTQIPPPTEWMFRAGVAYPIRAEMIGSGPGAERHCVFSTGAFVEPITVWDEPHLLRFSVASNPAPLEEWTPYHHIEPPHLHGFMASEQGQFLLTPLPDGGTRLEGTTWYHHGLWPESYWRLWSDPIIHQIHLRVLRHIRDEVERN